MRHTRPGLILLLAAVLVVAYGTAAFAHSGISTLAGGFTTERAEGGSSWVVSVRAGDSVGGFLRWKRTFADRTTRVRTYDVRYANIHANDAGLQEGWIAAELVSDSGGPVPGSEEDRWFVAKYVDGGQPGSSGDVMGYSPWGQTEETARNAVENWTTDGLAGPRSTKITRGNFSIRSF